MSKYKVGDELRIREWDDMVAEFGLSGLGYIKTEFGFSERMRHLCGCDFTVSEIIPERGIYKSVEGIERKYNSRDYWRISQDMLEPRKEELLYIASDDELNKLLSI